MGAEATRIGSLCTGYGGLDMAAQAVIGGEVAWVSDIDPHVNALLEVRYPDVKNIGDLTTADPEPVDVITAGFPCQPVSTAGRRKGTDDDRWIWDDIAALAGRMDPPPRLLLLENVPGLLSANGGDALARVVHGLAALGYVGRWRLLRASDVGACHRRERWFCVAHPSGEPPQRLRGPGLVAGTPGTAEGDGEQWERGWDAAADSGETALPTPTVTQGRNRTAGRKPDAVFSIGDTLKDVRYADRWGDYAAAIARHETVTGTSAPEPTTDGRLNPAFVEWMMMLPAGWVTDSDLSRSAQLRILGNGVVPPQAEAAYRSLLDQEVSV